MDVKEMSAVAETTVTTVPNATQITVITNPTVVVAQMASKEYLKIFELAEHCRMAIFTLKECENKVQTLISAKNEAARLKNEYITRNKTNIANYESLLQVKNELFQYKSELKSKYVGIEKAAKTKKLHYGKLISSYKTNWQKALGEYESNPLVKELNEIKRNNIFVEKKIEKYEKLKSTTEIQFPDLERNIRQKFLNKIVEFSQAVIRYKKLIVSQQIHGPKNQVECSLTSRKNKRMKFSKSIVPAFGQTYSINTEDVCGCPGVDVSVFDQLMVPKESLECQNEEDELLDLIRNQKLHFNDDGGYQEERAEIEVKDYHQPEEQGETMINTERIAREENESHYFRTQGTECLKHLTAQSTMVDNWGSSIENLNEFGNKKFNEHAVPSTGVPKGNNDVTCIENNLEISKENGSEKSMSEASYENQGVYSREGFDYGYHKTHSVSSEETALSADNTNESFSSPHKIMNFEQTNIFKLNDDQEKEDSKLFEDFFAINSDKNSAKPTIFKLF